MDKELTQEEVEAVELAIASSWDVALVIVTEIKSQAYESGRAEGIKESNQSPMNYTAGLEDGRVLEAELLQAKLIGWRESFGEDKGRLLGLVEERLEYLMATPLTEPNVTISVAQAEKHEAGSQLSQDINK